MKDLSVHRTTAELFELVDSPRTTRNRLKLTRIVRVLVPTVTALTLIALCGAPVAAEDPAPKEKPAPKVADGDAPEAGDQVQSVFAMSEPKTTDEDWK